MGLREVVYGVAIADAIGNRLEFINPTEQDFKVQLQSPLECTDDTQMMLFALEASKKGWSIGSGYRRWYVTQTRAFGDVAGGLLDFPEMYKRQSPGNTCMNACYMLTHYKGVGNDSKGNGTVMRCAHMAYLYGDLEEQLECAMKLARWDAEITHKHPYAAVCSVILVALHWYMKRGDTLHTALLLALDTIEVPLPVRKLLVLMTDQSLYSHYKGKLGGWVAEEALALAVGAAMWNDTYLKVVKSAVMFHGDSDTVGAIAGGLAAARGLLPSKSLPEVDLKNSIEYVLSL